MSDLKKQERQRMLLEEIKRSQGIITKRELAEKFCITERTIIRDIKEILQENHIIMVISGRCGGYKIIKGYDNNK